MYNSYGNAQCIMQCCHLPNVLNLLIWFSIKISMSALRIAMAVIQLGQTAATHLEALSVTV